MKKTYHGSCHCGAITLAVKSQPLDKEYPETVMDCACSICSFVSFCFCRLFASIRYIKRETH